MILCKLRTVVSSKSDKDVEKSIQDQKLVIIKEKKVSSFENKKRYCRFSEELEREKTLRGFFLKVFGRIDHVKLRINK